jgi:hypothetical protein
MNVPGSIQISDEHVSTKGGADVVVADVRSSSVGDSVTRLGEGVGIEISVVAGIGVAGIGDICSGVDEAKAADINRLAKLHPKVRARIKIPQKIEKDRACFFFIVHHPGKIRFLPRNL